MRLGSVGPKLIILKPEKYLMGSRIKFPPMRSFIKAISVMVTKKEPIIANRNLNLFIG
jgi:hypothetical protein